MRRMYPAHGQNLVKKQVVMVRAVVCFCPNVSEFARMYPNVAECIANVCPNVCFGSEAALMVGLTWDLPHGILTRSFTNCGVTKPSLWLASGIIARTSGPTTTCSLHLTGVH